MCVCCQGRARVRTLETSRETQVPHVARPLRPVAARPARAMRTSTAAQVIACRASAWVPSHAARPLRTARPAKIAAVDAVSRSWTAIAGSACLTVVRMGRPVIEPRTVAVLRATTECAAVHCAACAVMPARRMPTVAVAYATSANSAVPTLRKKPVVPPVRTAPRGEVLPAVAHATRRPSVVSWGPVPAAGKGSCVRPLRTAVRVSARTMARARGSAARAVRPSAPAAASRVSAAPANVVALRVSVPRQSRSAGWLGKRARPKSSAVRARVRGNAASRTTWTATDKVYPGKPVGLTVFAQKLRERGPVDRAHRCTEMG